MKQYIKICLTIAATTILLMIGCYAASAQIPVYINNPSATDRPVNVKVNQLVLDSLNRRVFSYPTLKTRREHFNSGYFAKDGKNGQPGASVTGPMGPMGPAGPIGIPGTGSMNFGTIRFVGTFAEYQSAMQAALTGSCRTIQLTGSFTQTAKIRLTYTPDNPSFNLTLIGNGNRITIASGIDTATVRSYTNIDTASVKIDFQLHLQDIEFSAPTTCIMFYLSSCYQVSFYNSKFFGGRTPIEARFVLQGTIRECRFSDWGYCAVNLDYDEFSGGNNFSSQSNHWLLEQNNYRSPDYKATGNAFACVRSRGNSGLTCFHEIYEGGDWKNNNKGCDFGLWIDDNGSPVVKIPLALTDCHGEFTPALSLFYIKQNDGITSLVRCYMQKTGVFVDYNSANYGKIIIDQLPWTMGPADFKFKSSGTGGRWFFNYMPATVYPLSADRWSGPMPPATWINQIPGTQEDGQKAFILLAGKRVLTEQ